MSSVASQFLSVALAIDIIVGHGLSNIACSTPAKEDNGDVVLAIHFIVGGNRRLLQ